MKWKEVDNFLRSSSVLRIATITPQGRPHLTPLAYVLHRGRFYSCSLPTSVKLRNIRANPYVSLLIDKDEPVRAVLVEGRARILNGTKRARAIIGVFERRLGWSLPRIIEVSPEKIIAWKEQYRTGASRFRMPRPN